MVTFVGGGSDGVRLPSYEEDEVPKGKAVPPKVRRQIYTQHTLGERPEDIAESLGLSVGGVRKIIRDERKAVEEEHKMSEIVIAGDKRNGRLVSTGTNQYEGTCLVDGKMKRKSFTTVNGRKATEMWEKWCSDLRDEQQFMDMVERKQEPQEEPLDLDIRPWREVAEEREREIEELRAKLDQWENGDWVQGSIVRNLTAERDALKARVEHAEAAVAEVGWDEMPNAYVLWAKAPQPRLYGAYRTMEAALGEVDKLNEIAAFLGQESAFEVEEVQWRH